MKLTVGWKKSLISNTDFSNLENDFLLELVISKKPWGIHGPLPPGGGVCGVGVGLRGGELVGRHVECYVHSKPGLEIKFEIAVFEIRDNRFQDIRG
jgi:hypothetical protein